MLINDKLFESLSPLFKTSRVLGLCPGTYRRQHNIHNVLWSRKTYICGVSLTSLLVCWSVWGFVKDMTAASFLTLGFQGSIDFFIASFDFSEVVAAAFYFIVSIPFKARSVCRIVDNFNKIDLLLGDTSVDCVRKRVICFSVFMVVLYVLDLFMWGNNSWEGFNNYCPFYILYCVVIAHQVQYWHLVNLLRRRLYMMNSAIKTNLDWNVPFTSIGRTVQIYDLVCDSVDEINKCFGVSITIILFSCYVHLALNPYMLFVIASNNDKNIFSYVYFLWIFVHIFRLMAIIEVCHSFSEESKKTGRLVFKLLCSCQDNDAKNEMRTFIFMLTKTKIKFSSYALPKISRLLIPNMIASISTYWMILLQFSRRAVHL
ncbi:hypothetical protein MTP99_006364 [Tenebrio molitor]|nr:hypothetical protein MTP99_006364 [Tenebrio molitor]